MKLLLVLSFVVLAMGHPTSPKLGYHEAVGIKLAARIKAAESAMDFSGSRVIGGSPSPVGQHPYLAGMLITLQSGQLSVCSGALVSHTRIVFAATCNNDGTPGGLAQAILAVLGSELLMTGGWRLQGGIVYQHPGYTWVPNPQNDIALVTIPWIGYSFWVSNVDMPDGLLGVDLSGMYAQFAGFGVNAPGTAIQPGQVQHQVPLLVISNDDCTAFYDEATVLASNLCTSGGTEALPQGPCNGDRGGPLVVHTGGRPVLIGVMSFFATPLGLQTCEPGAPSVFARMTYFAFWVNANLQ